MRPPDVVQAWKDPDSRFDAAPNPAGDIELFPGGAARSNLAFAGESMTAPDCMTMAPGCPNPDEPWLTWLLPCNDTTSSCTWDCQVAN